MEKISGVVSVTLSIELRRQHAPHNNHPRRMVISLCLRPENVSGEGLLSWDTIGRGLWLGAGGKFDSCCSAGGGGGAEDRLGGESGHNCKRQTTPIEKI
ncbi:hypothetical protein HAX54_010377 [Datura stramonium]|uniref:Uncharacterized protein n=1 Tax=Datura stramonium TaxID=4076 RepID=A0ABS8WYG6_DATST|nr:hypothetical protein [Datura stramonium]